MSVPSGLILWATANHGLLIGEELFQEIANVGALLLSALCDSPPAIQFTAKEILRQTSIGIGVFPNCDTGLRIFLKAHPAIPELACPSRYPRMAKLTQHLNIKPMQSDKRRNASVLEADSVAAGSMDHLASTWQKLPFHLFSVEVSQFWIERQLKPHISVHGTKHGSRVR